jgi:hypothetical protein
VLALLVLPVGFITGKGAMWTQPRGDLNAYVVAWEYFVRDKWRLPVLDLPAMNYPEEANVLLVDALPIGQLASKALFSVAGVKVNPFGWWIFLCYVLQGAMAARVVYAAGARSPYAAISAAILATATLPFVSRVWHVAASSHFLILWALALYLEDVRGRRFSAVEHCVLSSLALLVNSYLFVMVGCLQAATFVTLWKDGLLSWREWRAAMLAALAVVAVGILEGYGELLTGPGTMRAEGFGYFTWNPVSLLVPPEDYWGAHGIVRDATGGQREGESYLGLGGVLVLLASLVFVVKPAARAIRRHWVLALTLGACATVAASHRVYVGSHLLVDLPMPLWAIDAGSLFRATGRFVWVVGYALAVIPLALLVRLGPRRVAIPLIVGACIFQLWEFRAQARPLRAKLNTPEVALFDTAQLNEWITGHFRVFQYPSWSCGGFWSTAPPTEIETSLLREMQINLLVARRGLGTNSAYTSRPLKDCSAEWRWAAHAPLHRGVLYLINKHHIPQTTGLLALSVSDSCIDAGWGLICSRDKQAGSR